MYDTSVLFIQAVEGLMVSSDVYLNKVNFFGMIWLYFSGVYLTKVTSFSPVYLGFILVFLYTFLAMPQKNKVTISYFELLCVILSLMSLFLALNSPFNMVVNVFITLFSIVIVSQHFRYRSINFSSLVYFFLFYLFFFSIEAGYRISNPIYDNVIRLSELGVGYIIYKINSIMYIDSNFVGLQILSYFCSLLFILRYESKSIKKSRIIKLLLMLYFILILLTFSRAAIVGALFSIIVFYSQISKRIRLVSFLIIPLFSFWGYLEISEAFANDVSFNSKFHLFDSFFIYLYHADIYQILLGVGLGNAIDVIGMGAHNLMLTLIIETGLIGFTCFMSVLIFLCFKLRMDSIYIVLPFLIVSMSLSGTAIPYIMTLFYLLVLIKSEKFKVIH